MSEDLFTNVQTLLDSIGSDIGVSEVHGMLCGALSGPGPFDLKAWLAHVTGEEEFPVLDSETSRATIGGLVAQTEKALKSDELEFDLLLPDDGQALAVRANAFAAWCRGYLSGFGLTGIADLRVLGEDAREFLDDLGRFGTLTVEDEDEEGERALNELTEFTRVGVLLVRSDLASRPRTPAGPSRTH